MSGPVAQLGGITICELQADLEHHGVSVESQALNMYQSSKMITIAGKGFNPEGTKFRFANGIKENTDYTADVEETSAVLTLVEGRKWISVGPCPPACILRVDCCITCRTLHT